MNKWVDDLIEIKRNRKRVKNCNRWALTFYRRKNKENVFPTQFPSHKSPFPARPELLSASLFFSCWCCPSEKWIPATNINKIPLVFHCLRNSLRSPCSMNSKIMQNGSSSVDTANNLRMLSCWRTDISATSWLNEALATSDEPSFKHLTATSVLSSPLITPCTRPCRRKKRFLHLKIVIRKLSILNSLWFKKKSNPAKGSERRMS